VGRVVQKGKRGGNRRGEWSRCFPASEWPDRDDGSGYDAPVAVLSQSQDCRPIEPVPFTLNALLRNVQAVDARRFSWAGGRRSIEGSGVSYLTALQAPPKRPERPSFHQLLRPSPSQRPSVVSQPPAQQLELANLPARCDRGWGTSSQRPCRAPLRKGLPLDDMLPTRILSSPPCWCQRLLLGRCGRWRP